jgi:preprotein translocase subunit SecD
MSDLEQLLRDTLHDPRFTPPVDTDPDLMVREVLRHHRRRRIVSATAVVVVVLGVATLTAASLTSGGSTTRVITPSSSGPTPAVVLSPMTESTVTPATLHLSAQIIAARLDGLRLTDWHLSVNGRRLVVSLASPLSPAQLRVVSQRGALEFRQICTAGPPTVTKARSSSDQGTMPRTCTPVGGKAPIPPASVLSKYKSLSCSKNTIRPAGYIDQPKQWLAACLDPSVNAGTSARYLLLPAAFTGKNLSGASAQIEQNNGVTRGRWQVELSFKPSVQHAVYDLTKKLQGITTTGIAVVLDGVVESAPYIESAFSANAEITGNFTRTQAQDLADILEHRELPINFTAQVIGGQT